MGSHTSSALSTLFGAVWAERLALRKRMRACATVLRARHALFRPTSCDRVGNAGARRSGCRRTPGDGQHESVPARALPTRSRAHSPLGLLPGVRGGVALFVASGAARLRVSVAL